MPSQEQSLKTASEHEPDSLPARPDSLPARPDCLPTRPDSLPTRIVTAVGILLICLPLLLAGTVTSFLLALGISNLAAALQEFCRRERRFGCLPAAKVVA